MNRIDQKFQELKAAKKKAFIGYITAGYPSLKMTEELVLGLEKSGVDIIELGVPFSDPLADGPTIQAASQKALEKGTTLEKIFDVVEKIRKASQVPICLMTYFNPVFHYGEKKFVQTAKQKGVDGVIIPDLPPEEAGQLISEARIQDLSTVFFLAPTTKDTRIKKIVNDATGFIYYVSIAGVTGERTEIPASVVANVKKAKKITDKPICVGFGISNPQQVKKIAHMADGVIVGSAIINQITENMEKRDSVKKVCEFVSSLTKVL